MNNYDRLLKAGVLKPKTGTKIGTDDLKAIESLSSQEVDHLISASAKLGPVITKSAGDPGHTLIYL